MKLTKAQSVAIGREILEDPAVQAGCLVVVNVPSWVGRREREQLGDLLTCLIQQKAPAARVLVVPDSGHKVFRPSARELSL